MDLETEITVDGEDLPGLLSLEKQLNYAAALAVNDTLRSAVDNVVEEIQSTFDVTNPWYLPSNRYGIHYTRATRDNPTGSLHTNAYWLKPHETGDDKEPVDGDFLAIPTEQIKEPHKAIPPALRPRNLKDAFVLKTKSGPKLFRRINNRLQLVYNFARRVRIKRQSTVVDPTIKTVETEFSDNFQKHLKEALRTAK